MIPLFFLHYRISTHTLTWSVTKQAMSGVMLYYISTHTLTWSVTRGRSAINLGKLFQLTRSRGAWPRQKWCGDKHSNFNSHAHVERDFAALVASSNVSKFQLTRSRGAWRQHAWRSLRYCKFQLTRSRGAWRKHTYILTMCEQFQLTRSRGAWHLGSAVIYAIQNFNSHAHVERDQKAIATAMRKYISTHTLTWSVTKG